MTSPKKQTSEAAIREIRRRTRRKFSPEEKIRIVLEGLRGEESIAALCRREGLNPNLYYRWSKEFLEAGKKRLLGDTTREATSSEVGALRQDVAELKQVVAELVLENFLRYDLLARCDLQRMAAFRKRLTGHPAVAMVPNFAEDLHAIADLKKMLPHLVGGAGGMLA